MNVLERFRATMPRRLARRRRAEVAEAPTETRADSKPPRKRRRTALRVVVGIAAAVIAFELVFIVLHAASALIGPIIDVDPAALASGRLRVLCLGESTTASGYPALLQQSLERALGKDSVVVINAGWRGVRAETIKRRVPRFLQKYQPDVVVTMIGINDEIIERKGNRWYTNSAVGDSIRDMGGMNEHSTGTASEERVAASMPDYAQPYREIVAALEKDGVAVLAAQYPMRPVSDLAALLARNPDVVYVDNEASFRRGVDKKGFDFYFEDNFAGDFGYMTDAGMRLFADTVAERLVASMSDWREGCRSDAAAAGGRRICRLLVGDAGATDPSAPATATAQP